MNLEYVSVENRPEHRQSYLPGFEESTIFSPACPHPDNNREPIIPWGRPLMGDPITQQLAC